MPEKVLKKLNTYILPQWRVCFFSALFIGLFAHLYKIINWLPNWDSLVFRYDSQNMIALGRWFLPVVCGVSSFYDLPFLNGITSIIFHALSGVFICRILNIKKSITAFLIGAVIITFPTVTSVMMYNYVADGYSIAFFLSVVGAFYMTKEKPHYILSVILIALSVGIYQAYITVTIMLVLLYLIDKTIHNNMSVKDTLKKSLKIFLAGFLGMVLYYVILKLLLAFYPGDLLDYQGINSALTMSGIDIKGSLYTIKETFVNCFFDVSKGFNLYVILNIFTVILTLLHYIKYIYMNRIYKSPMRLFILIILSSMLIFGAGVLALINAGIDYHNLMLMGYSVFYIFFIIIYERGSDKNKIQERIRVWSVFIISIVIIFNQVVIANVSYHKAQIAYEKSYGTLIRIVDRIEQTPDSDKSNTILVIGALDNSSDYSVNLSPDITGITDGYIIRADDEVVGQSVLCSALNDYCDKNYNFLNGEKKKSLMEHQEIKDMPGWPMNGCIRVVDNIIVIKLGAESE